MNRNEKAMLFAVIACASFYGVFPSATTWLIFGLAGSMFILGTDDE